jgi:hypothetical protein
MKLRLVLSLQLPLVFLALVSTSLANTWYADANNGNDNNNCLSASAACKTIGHAITLAASGDSITLAPGDYSESITIPFSLNIVGGNAQTTSINGQGASVVTIPEQNPVSIVTISGVTITGGYSGSDGGAFPIGVNWQSPTVSSPGTVRSFLAAGSRPTAVAGGLPRLLSTGPLLATTELRRAAASNVPGRLSP